jgi:hypothetical protein
MRWGATTTCTPRSRRCAEFCAPPVTIWCHHRCCYSSKVRRQAASRGRFAYFDGKRIVYCFTHQSPLPSLTFFMVGLLLGLVFVRFRTLQHHHHRQFPLRLPTFQTPCPAICVRFPVLLGEPILLAISPVQNRIARRYCFPMSEKNESSVWALDTFFSDIGNCTLVAPHFLVTHYDRFGRSTRMPSVLDESSVDRERHLLRSQHTVSNLGNSYCEIAPLKQMRAIFIGTTVVIAVSPLCPVIFEHASFKLRIDISICDISVGR